MDHRNRIFSHLGEAIRVEYTFDPSTVDSEASIDRGLYENAITDLTVIVGGNTYTSDPGSGFTGSIFVGNNITLSTTTMETIDGYSVSIRSLTGANIGSLPMSFFALILRDYTQSMFDSDALPSAQPIPSDVTNSQIDLFFGGRENPVGSLILSGPGIDSGLLSANGNPQAISAIPLHPSLWLVSLPVLRLFLQGRSANHRRLNH